MRFRDYLRHAELLSEDSPPPPPKGGPGGPPGLGGSPPLGGPPLGGGGPPNSPPILGGGAPPPLPPPMGGGMPPLGPPPGGAMGGGGNPPPMNLKTFDVWEVLYKLLHGKPIEDDREPSSPTTPNSTNDLSQSRGPMPPPPGGNSTAGMGAQAKMPPGLG